MDSVYNYLDESTESRDELPTTENAPMPMLDGRELAYWRWANVTNVDAFLSDVYSFFLDKGFWCIVLKRFLNMLTVLFVVIFSTYLTHCIDWSHLHGARTLDDVRIGRCLAKSSFFTKVVLWLFGALWLLKLFQYVSDVPRLLELKAFYEFLLKIDENELQTISWPQVLERMSRLKDMNFKAGPANPPVLDAHNVANRIMRRENYMIALFSRDVFNLDVQFPIVGKTQFLTKTLEWSISLCVLDFIFNEQGYLRPVFLSESKRGILSDGLKRRFRFAAVMNIVLAPFAIVYMSLYYFFKYFNEYHKDPSTMGTRQYTPLAEWKMRELNELYHLFRRRLSMSTLPAKRYISQFPREKTDIMLRFIVFVFSSFAAVLGILSIYDPELLGLEISPDKTVLFFIGIFGTIIAVARGAAASEAAIFEPEAAMLQIIEFTHYFPDDWELHTEKVKNEFCQLYDLKIKILIRDFLSIFLNPIILWYNLPASCDKIIDFIRVNTAKVDGLGYVCSYAVFDDQVQKVKDRAEELDKFYASSDGKMLKSYLNFMDVYGPDSGKDNGSYITHLSTSPRTSPRSSQKAMQSIDLSQSVMGQYQRIQKLPSIQEERNLSADSTSSAGELFNLLQQESRDSQEDSSVSGDIGVFGLLNKISKAEGRRGPLR